MGSFPRTESKVMALARTLKGGLIAHTDIYPEPPVPSAALTAALDALQQAKDEATNARALAEAATARKVELLTELVELMKKDLRYAQIAADGNDEQLKLLGWSARKPASPIPVPGQPGNLVVRSQGNGNVDLAWQSPPEGGPVAAYLVLRRPRMGTGAWTEVASVIPGEARLKDQPRGVELEYVIEAANRSGRSPKSNTVTVIL